MHRAVTVLCTLLVLVAPIYPTGASAQLQDGDRSTYDGDHVRLTADGALPGVRNVTLARSGALVFDAVDLPGNATDVEASDDRFRMRTDEAGLRFDDRPELTARFLSDGDQPVTIHVADSVGIEGRSDEDGARYELTPSEGPSLVLAGDLTRDGHVFSVLDDAFMHAASQPDDGNDTDDETTEDAPRDDTDDTSEDRNRSETPRSGENDSRDRDEDADRDRDDRRSPRARPATDGAYAVGSVRFQLDGDRLENLTVRGELVLAELLVPGLRPAEHRQRGPTMELDGEDARVRLHADGGLLLRVRADGPLTAHASEDVEIQKGEDHVLLRTGSVLLVVEGDELAVSDRTLRADGDLRIAGKTQAGPGQSDVWRPERVASQPSLPIPFEGRFVSFTLTQDGLTNLTVHGTPLGEIGFTASDIEEARRAGAQLRIEGETFELRAVDAPAARIHVEARNLTTDIPVRTTLPSGAQVLVDVEDGELALQVTRPAGALSNRTAVEHRPSETPVERTPGPHPGLTSRTDGGELGVVSRTPSRLAASFDGQLNGTEGNVSMNLGLVRAMLVEDTNGNGQIDVGEPALAQRSLASGTSHVDGDTLVSRFPLWSGNLTVEVEPGAETAKVTYRVENLNAPPGTLFVLETEVSAPEGASLRPSDTGVTVRNGSMTAQYTAAGPVTVDGASAWADHSIFVDSNGTVSVLLAYPAGDDIVHDPTVSIQSLPGAEVVQRFAASPYAILAGALAAALLVGVTAWQRQRSGPRP